MIAFVFLAVELWWRLIEMMPGGLLGLAFLAGFAANTACRVVAYLVGREVWG